MFHKISDIFAIKTSTILWNITTRPQSFNYIFGPVTLE